MFKIEWGKELWRKEHPLVFLASVALMRVIQRAVQQVLS